MLLDLADFALQEQPEDSLMVISRAWYNGSYTMAAKPIKFLVTHYIMIYFLIIILIPWCQKWRATIFNVQHPKHLRLMVTLIRTIGGDLRN